MRTNQPRPVFLNLLKIRQPVTAVASFAHRVSGVLLFLAIPLCIYLLELSLSGPEGYVRAGAIVSALPARVLQLVFAWAVFHHVLAGVRHLLMDLDIGTGLAAGTGSAHFVTVAGGVLTLLTAGWLFL